MRIRDYQAIRIADGFFRGRRRAQNAADPPAWTNVARFARAQPRCFLRNVWCDALPMMAPHHPQYTMVTPPIATMGVWSQRMSVLGSMAWLQNGQWGEGASGTAIESTSRWLDKSIPPVDA